MKKMISSVVCVLMVFSLFGCGNSAKLGKEDFEKWCKNLPEKLLGNKAYEIYSVVENPKKLGINMDVKGLDFYTYQDYKDSAKANQDIQEKLKSFAYDDLNLDQKITYDLLQEATQDTKASKDKFYLETNYFDVSNGVHANLALNLYFMDFKSQEALDAMIKVMKSTKEIFPKYVDFEKERQDNGFGMSKTYLGEVIEQVHTFNAQSHDYLLEGNNQKIDEATFLDDMDKKKYKDKFKNAYEQEFIPAFQQLEADLNTIKVKTKDEDASLADYKGGKKYYEEMIKETTGFDSVSDFREFLEEEKMNIAFEAEALVNEYPSLQEEILAPSEEGPVYTKATSVAEVLTHFEEIVNTGEEFPKVEKFDYQMDEVPVSLQEIFKAAAAYFVGPYDNPKASEQMILNGSYSQSDYGTIAHEGFPGHMYQNHYFRNTGANVIRSILGNSGYSEGWAVYADKAMGKYAEDKELVSYYSLNENIVYIYMMEIDMMIHYDNASREDIYEFIKETFQNDDEEGLKEQYEQILEDPAIFFPYYGYYFRLNSLKEEVKDEWGKDFSEYKFNKKILDLGALPYDLLEKYVEETYK